MTNPNYRFYLMIVDRSGSMIHTAADAEGGIRQFIKDQAALDGNASVTLVQFDDRHDTVWDFATIGRAEAEGYKLVPRGLTRLLDACGSAITSAGEKLAAMREEDRPGKVSVVIVTDGEENDSREYSLDRVREMITHQHEVYGWQFTYIGANVDAFAVAGAMGIGAQGTLHYRADAAGTAGAWASASASNSRFMSGQSASLSYTSGERDAAAGN